MGLHQDEMRQKVELCSAYNPTFPLTFLLMLLSPEEGASGGNGEGGEETGEDGEWRSVEVQTELSNEHAPFIAEDKEGQVDVNMQQLRKVKCHDVEDISLPRLHLLLHMPLS